ncbi:MULTISPECIES: mammalian cell entry protein [Mycobacterium]|uniref:Mce associated protein n=1 Tax=Mycobacterium kiyosense TaxID=2871094 RepID=A0A9P3UY52_9MYCO|nr:MULTISPECIES: mammalian cell entry protein [Mycobacterium]BDB45200.1 Mce associated protein [Mycobacterium kiyosense]BDE16675.1 Mce associated protein [Mycobacterium sp. 20KCMC460]GLB84824.1 Mce associated protein [Mycobacterium kiyosense]GLB89945.1 Mce associated protein [Mycobacterium kiyosense]GLB95915.1 Mce associated protein [Mycobacterium kiyosense]
MRWSRWLATAAAYLAIVAIVGLSAVGGWYYWDRVQARGAQAARDALPTLVAKEMPQVLGYDFQTVERSLGDTYPMMTPDYRQEFKKRANEQIIPEAKKREVVIQANVVGVGVMEANRNSAAVMVFMNRTVTDKARQPIYEGIRVRVEFQRIGGKWLIAFIKPI